jgi:hypothetical protein
MVSEGVGYQVLILPSFWVAFLLIIRDGILTFGVSNVKR